MPPRRRGALLPLIMTMAVALVVAWGWIAPSAAHAVVPVQSATLSARTTGTPQADPSGATLQVRITSVNPTVAGPGDTPTITGEILNGADADTPAGDVRAVRGPATLIDTVGVTDWATSASPATGSNLATAPLPGIPAGGSIPFTVTLPPAGTLTAQPYDVLPVSLEFAGAVTHTFVAVQRTREYQPLSLAWLVPLTVDPVAELYGPLSIERAQAWQSVLGPESRLARVLESFPSATNIGYAVDADLVQPEPSGTVASSGTPAPGVTPSLTPSPGASATSSATSSASPGPPVNPGLGGMDPAEAENLVRGSAATRIVTAMGASTPWILPAGDPDVAALPDTPPLTNAVARADTAARLVSGRTDVVWPADPAWSAEAGKRYAALWGRAPAGVIVGRDSLNWTVDQGNAGRRAVDGTPLLASSDALVEAAQAAVRPESAGAGRQLFLALTVAQLRESPGLDRTVLVALPRTIDPDPASTGALRAALAQVPWLTQTSVSAVLAQAASAPSRTEAVSAPPGVPSTVAPSPLSSSTRQSLLQVADRARGAAEIRADRTIVLADWLGRLGALDSTRWRGQADAFEDVRSHVADEVDASVRSVRVAPQTINFLADSGRLQMTVLNDLDVGVTGVRVELVPDNPRLRVADAVKEVAIGARSRTTVTYDATALAAGPVRVEARVTGPSGISVGPTTLMDVRVSPTGNWIYVLLGALALLTLALGLARGRSARRRRGETDLLPPNAIQLDEDGDVVETPASEPALGDTPSEETAPIAPEESVTTKGGTAPSQTAGSATIARSGAIMAAGTLSSRILGVIRVSLLAGIIGTTGLSADAFGVANTLPNQFYLILAGGILNAVLVPQIVRAMKHSDGGQEFVNRIVTLALLLLLAATVLVTVAAPLLVMAYSKVKYGPAFQLAVAFAFICLPQVFFYGLYTLLGQILNANNRFAAYMWAPVVANLVSLGGLILFLASGQPRMAGPSDWTPTMIWILGGSSTLSIAMQALFLIIPLRRMGFRYRPVWGIRGVGLGSASKVAGWTFAAVLVAQLGFVITSKVLTRATELLAEQDAVGPGRATFDNAFLLFMLPHSLVTVSLVTALFTRMATSVQAADRQRLATDLLRGIRMPAVILVPGVTLVIAFADVITRVLFPGNSIPQTHAVAVVVMALYCGVIPFGWLYLSERFFYAHEDARTPFVIQVVVTALSQAGALVGATLDPRHTAIAVGLGQSFAYATGAVLGFTLIRRRLGRLGLGRVLTAYARLFLPAILSAALLSWGIHTLAPDLLEVGPMFCLLALVVVAPVHLVLTLGIAHLLGVRDVAVLLDPVLGRLRRLRRA